jgi:hypothetical protein
MLKLIKINLFKKAFDEKNEIEHVNFLRDEH